MNNVLFLVMANKEDSIKRSLGQEIEHLAFQNQKMAFLSGPRQVGKTYLAKTMGPPQSGKRAYYNWDLINFRRIWNLSPLDLIKDQSFIVFDEIHKARKWKGTLKGLYDHKKDGQHFLVTGSARLETFKRGGDSLLGRYFNFHLHPLTLGELHHQKVPTPEEFLKGINNIERGRNPKHEEILDRLLKFSGFPEPYLKADERFYELWSSGRSDKIVREDLRDISRIVELGQIEVLCALLPSRVGSPFSYASLSQQLEVSPLTLKRWMSFLTSVYFSYGVRPFSAKNARAIKKEGKVYLWDYAQIENMALRLENLVANHLFKACEYWTDLGYGKFELALYRDKEKREIDFVITRKNVPWAIFEVKSSDTSFSPHMEYFLKSWPGVKTSIVLTRTPNIQREVGENRYVLSLEKVLALLP